MKKTTMIVLIKRFAAMTLICLLIAAVFLPPAVYVASDEERAAVSDDGSGNALLNGSDPDSARLPATSGNGGAKVVRVGWYDSSYNNLDATGRRTGYAYEYQLKIASYTGWQYEYVSGSWSNLLQMLINGDIDLMSDVSYTDERTKNMLYPDLPMGTEDYFLFTGPTNSSISSSDVTTLNGKKIGVNKDSVQEIYFREWAEKNGVAVNLIELSIAEDESLRKIESGELDGYVTVDSFTDPQKAKPIFKIGSSDFYFAVNKSRPDLLAELNMAMSKIRDENRYYNQQMFERYINTSGNNAFLSNEEREWLTSHKKIRVGYQDNYLVFCTKDQKTGELTGALNDYLEYASKSLANADLEFEAFAYSSATAALEALKKGEIDALFPVNLSGYDGEKLGIFITMPIIDTDVYAVIRETEVGNFAKKEHVIVAVNDNNFNYDSFLARNFPDWRTVYYQTTDECLKAVKNRVADCVLISSYRYNNLSRLCNKYGLTTFPTGSSLDFCFAVNNNQIELYSILSKAIGQVPSLRVNSSLSHYITEDAKLTLSDFVSDHLFAFTLAALGVLTVILVLLIRSLSTERKSKALIKATETDALTGLYNRDYFFEYAAHLRNEHPRKPMDAIVINIEQFHSVNAFSGHEFGDRILQTLGSEIKAIAGESGGIGGRFGADRFDIYRPHADDYKTVFDRLQNSVDQHANGVSIRLRMGVMPFLQGLDPVQMFDRARTACSMARGHYKKHLIIFNEAVRNNELRDQQLLNDLKKALDNYEFEVYYQPKFNIENDKPKLTSVEALVRWQHPQLGMISPDDFVPLFERNGKIWELDKYVWAQAVKQIARWRAQYGMTLPVSVNISIVDLLDSTLKGTLDEILTENRLSQEALLLEITESAYTENSEQTRAAVEHLRQGGYTVEMDDFGSGYSSLNVLATMPIDVLKMDRAFVRDIEHSEKNLQLVALILGIAKKLNILVVAEGVETDSQLRMLRDLGCPVVQGYYFSRPLHLSDFESKYLQSSKEDANGKNEKNTRGDK